MIRLFTFGMLLCSTFCLHAQQLVSSTFLGHKSKAELLAEFNNLLFINYGANYYRVTYSTTNVHGLQDTTTGLVAIPDNPALKYPRLVYQHGTSGSKLDVPSVNVLDGGEGKIGYLFASLGYIAFLPDYIGLGPLAHDFHPYVHAESEAAAAIDLLHAGEALLGQLNTQHNQQLFITGYSQGGHAAMALHRSLEKNPVPGWTVTASAPMSGPYSISGVMRNLILSDTVYYYPAYIPNTALSYQTAYGNLFSNLEEVFKQPYAGLINQFYLNQITLSDLNEQLIASLTANEGACRPYRMLQPDIIQTIANNPNHPINKALDANDTYDHWQPEAPLRLFYCTADDQVPFRNALLASDSLMAAGAADFAIADVSPNSDHGACVVPALTSTVLFFLGYQQVGVAGNNDLLYPHDIALSPNPARDQVTLSSNTMDADCQLMDIQGKIWRRARLQAGTPLSMDVQGLPAGIWVMRLVTPQGTFSRTLVLNK